MADFPTMGELCEPQEGQAIRFCSAFSISQDLDLHGINGFYRDGRFWSADMADHWARHEVTRWKVGLAIPARVTAADTQRNGGRNA